MVDGLFVDSSTESLRIGGGGGTTSRGLEVASATGYEAGWFGCATIACDDGSGGDVCCDPTCSFCCCCAAEPCDVWSGEKLVQNHAKD